MPRPQWTVEQAREFGRKGGQQRKGKAYRSEEYNLGYSAGHHAGRAERKRAETMTDLKPSPLPVEISEQLREMLSPYDRIIRHDPENLWDHIESIAEAAYRLGERARAEQGQGLLGTAASPSLERPPSTSSDNLANEIGYLLTRWDDGEICAIGIQPREVGEAFSALRKAHKFITSLPAPPSSATPPPDWIRCHGCQTSCEDCEHLIEFMPKVFICDSCVQVCVELIAEAKASSATPERGDDSPTERK